MSFESINPATGEKINEYAGASPAEVASAVEAASDAFLSWKRVDIRERAKLMRSVARILRDSKDRWAKLMAEEMGKPVSQGRAEAEKSAWVCEYFAG